MTSNEHRGATSLSWPARIVLTLLVAAAAVTLLAVGYRLLRSARAPLRPQSSVVATEEPWPTGVATFTPLPTRTTVPSRGPSSTPTRTATPTATPSPTPIPLPVWSSMADLTVVEYTLATAAEARVRRPSPGWSIFGTDRVLLYVVGRVRVGVDLNKIRSEDVRRSGTTIALVLPMVEVQAVELLPGSSEIRVAEKRWAFSAYEGLELQAMEAARNQLREMVGNNPSMMSLAGELAKFRLAESLRRLGFTDITIEFRRP